MPTLLFVILPYPSHYLATFCFARMWQKQNYKVVFTGNELHRSLIEKEGFDFEPFYYGSEIRVQSIRLFLGFWLKSISDKKFTKTRYKEYYSRVRVINDVVKKYQPEIVFLDEHVGFNALYLAKSKLKLVVINTKLATRKRIGSPPLNSSFSPNAYLWSNIWCEWLWAKHLALRWCRKHLNNLAFNGLGELGFQRHLAKKNES